MYESTPQYSSKHSGLPIGWFVVFSLVLHVLLFWGVINNDQKNVMPAAQQASGGFHITLAPYQVPLQQSTETPRKNSVAEAESLKQKAKETPVNKHETTPLQSADSAFRERILTKLRQSISAHFVYPLLARQRNWQGEVLLVFRIERDGRISNARIAHSSGYSLLDHAALNALAQVKQLGEIVPQSLNLELPVIYRLES